MFHRQINLTKSANQRVYVIARSSCAPTRHAPRNPCLPSHFIGSGAHRAMLRTSTSSRKNSRNFHTICYVISSLIGIASYLTSHFIPATTPFIRIRIVSYLHMQFYTCPVSHLNKTFHTCDNLFHTYTYCFIPKHVISYLRQHVSYLQVLCHT